MDFIKCLERFLKSKRIEIGKEIENITFKEIKKLKDEFEKYLDLEKEYLKWYGDF